MKRELDIAEKFKKFLEDFTRLRKEIEEKDLSKPLEYHSYIGLFEFLLKNTTLKKFFEKEDLDLNFNIARFIQIAYERTYDKDKQVVRIYNNLYNKEDFKNFLLLLKPCKETIERYGSYLLSASPFILSVTIGGAIEIFRSFSQSLFKDNSFNWFILFIIFVVISFSVIFFQAGVNISYKKLNYALIETFILKIIEIEEKESLTLTKEGGIIIKAPYSKVKEKIEELKKEENQRKSLEFLMKNIGKLKEEDLPTEEETYMQGD